MNMVLLLLLIPLNLSVVSKEFFFPKVVLLLEYFSLFLNEFFETWPNSIFDGFINLD